MRSFILVAGLLCHSLLAYGVNVDVVGLFPGKAVLVVDGAAPKTYAAGAVVTEGVKLLSVSDAAATLEIDGKRQTIALGEHLNRIAPSAAPSVTLAPNQQGHYLVTGQINGGTVNMLLDTGATMVTLPAAEARRLGIDYKKGRIGSSNTANGRIPTYAVRLDSIKVGDIELRQVDANVVESPMAIILLGMSFLNRMEMKRDSQQMILTKRF